MNNLIVYRYNDLFWSYFKDIFEFLIDNKVLF